MVIIWTILLVTLAGILYVIALKLYELTHNTLHRVKMLKLDRRQRKLILQEPVRIRPDQAGTFPLLLEARGDKILDPGRGLLFTIGEGLVAATAEIARPEQMRRILQAAGGWPQQGTANLLEAPANAQWPTEIPLKSVVTEPDVRNLVLGVSVNESGQAETVRADMGKLVHVAVGGSSGWGKSVFLRSLAYQLALSQTPVDLAMIDLEGATLAPFAKCGRLLYPVADTEADALAILLALQDEMERRKALYAQDPGVDSLDAYNAMADEKLFPLVAIIDEATALLGDKSVEGALRTLALRARKYGLWLVMGGQDWKASSLDTAIRNQLSSRIQFKATSKSQSNILLGRAGAEDLDVAGRAWAVIPGKNPFLMQAPFISAKTIVADVSNGGARFAMPAGMADGRVDTETEKRIKALSVEGLGICAISDAVFGYHNASRTSIVKAVLGLD